MYGETMSAWERLGSGPGTSRLTAVVAPNTRATIRLPGARVESLNESGNPVGSVEGVVSVTQDGDAVVVEAGSGTYVFEYPITPGSLDD
jgi:alpha-L-rhamnosidase